VLVFLVADDLAQVQSEGVVVEVERVAGFPAGGGVPPEDPSSVVDQQDAVVAPLGDPEKAGDRMGNGSRLGRCLCGLGLCAQPTVLSGDDDADGSGCRDHDQGEGSEEPAASPLSKAASSR
jgi:hypothetical protein